MTRSRSTYPKAQDVTPTCAIIQKEHTPFDIHSICNVEEELKKWNRSQITKEENEDGGIWKFLKSDQREYYTTHESWLCNLNEHMRIINSETRWQIYNIEATKKVNEQTNTKKEKKQSTNTKTNKFFVVWKL